MNDREKIRRLLETVPEYKLGYIIAYIQGLNAEEEADDAFCEKLYQDYLNSDDPDKDEFVSLEDAARACGVDLDELQN